MIVIVKFLYSNRVVFFSLQNSVCEDYVTEKFFNILDYNIIPVTYSGANFSVGKYFAENESHHNPLSRPWPRPTLTSTPWTSPPCPSCQNTSWR